MGAEVSSEVNSGILPSSSHKVNSNKVNSQISLEIPSNESNQSNQSLNNNSIMQLKILLRGKRQVGKTQLFRRLQGLSFLSTYQPTTEIDIKTITWSHNKLNDDEHTAKIEIWDVIDQGITNIETSIDQMIAQASTNSASGSYRISSLDASIIDVYKNSDAVIFLINPFDKSSFDYVK